MITARSSFTAQIAIAIAMALVPASAANAAHEPEADRLIKKAADALEVKAEQSTYRMTIKRAGDEKTRVMDVWFERKGDDEARALLKIKEPPNLRGTALLTTQEKGEKAKQWLYLPAYKKARRIRRGTEEEPFLGSDFSIGDLSVDQAELYSFSKSSDGPCGDPAPGAECHVLEGKPEPGVDPDELTYSRKRMYLRKDTGLHLRSEFFGKDGKLRKVMTVHGLKRSPKGHWEAEKLRMEDFSRRSVTEITFDKREVGKVPPRHYFTVENLEK
ncbi:MAG: outer membrane lipoprotein-sorting protein [Bdellovibrionales bacterium]|nr:outer membrane lipoprotein-sorting protein [Bdellovibrionales bacterium]